MNNFRYTLEKYTGRNSRYTCPQCEEPHRFTRYIDTHTGEHLGHDIGRCNREVKCGYHKTPGQHFAENPIVGNPKYQNSIRHVERRETSPDDMQRATSQHVSRLSRRSFLSPHNDEPISGSVLTTYDFQLTTTLTDYDDNHLVRFLIGRLGVQAVQSLLQQYRVGTHHHWRGSTVFWYIDTQQRIHSGKVMLYNSLDGKRVKQPFNHVTWMHSLLKMEGYQRKPCLFGEHLLHNTVLPVSIVESEKTALIAAHYLPQSIWLATGGISSMNIAHAKEVLRGRKVTLFPDEGGYDKWQALAAQLPNCNISPMLNYYAYRPGNDLADLLLCA